MSWIQPIGVRMIPANFGPMRGFDAHARIEGDCGDTMEAWLRVDGDQVLQATFTTDGCDTSVASGSVAAHLCQGKTFDQIRRELTPMTVLEALGLAETEGAEEAHHCADLALRTFEAAVEDLLKWRRAAAAAQECSHGTCGGGAEQDGGCGEGCCSECTESCGERKAPGPSRFGQRLLVLSGKGGVGKSTVAVNLALALAGEGYRVGLLDADLHGPSIPKLLGLEEHTLQTEDERLVPVELGTLQVMSIGFALEGDQAAIWRGPMKASVIEQFVNRVAWGPLDALIIDCPPGTGDEHLSLVQTLGQVDGAVIVTTPQEVAALDARKAITFCRAAQVPILGVVENMSGFTCPDCGSVTPIFQGQGGERMAAQYQVPFLGALPLDPRVGEGGDAGCPWLHRGEAGAPESFRRIIRPLVERLQSAKS